MSTSHLRLIATVAVIAATATTGAVTGLLAATEEASFAVPAAVAGAAGAALAGVCVLLILAGRLQPAAAAGTEQPDPAALATIDQLGAERRTLINTCIYVRDRATSQAIADRIGAGLAEAGVATVAPVGERFDPTRHEAGGTTPAPDPSQDGVIAVVETLGYADRAAMLRNPIVTVYRSAGA
ncbi:GrpE protein [Stackebrandtia albiflava]|uniref:GrpE protein n=1 Tax=Stackebrandtia albiflava TaxID=406432 RepID=A0A562VDH5_9ACTN|nr:nucleotide exchange factor GrpE [Stackebrandtia albiflava]TWJ15867.1 GrpE protein [Stackebrandtia albiflava]